MFRFTKTFLLLLGIILLSSNNSYGYFSEEGQVRDSVEKARQLLQDARVRSAQKSIQITIRNVDITRFPQINIIVEAFDIQGKPLDTLYAESLTVLEGGQEMKVISVEKISVGERVPVDFVFVLDITGTMQKHMDAVRENIIRFTNSLVQRGIDYKIGLITFSDVVERVYQPVDNVYAFIGWLNSVRAYGGGDEKENALEALKAAVNKLQYRPAANRVAVLITDAPYHQRGEQGDGITDQTTESIVKMLQKSDIRVFAIAPPRLKEYNFIAERTRGNLYDIEYPFSTILSNFSNQLTNLYAIRYLTGQKTIPDSLPISILDDKREVLVNKVIPVVELGRKMIIDNLLYKTNSADLADTLPELDIVVEYMLSKPNIAIMIEGHTDAVGSHEINDRLSLARAESVKRYLVGKGIAAHRIKTQGFGKRRPLASNSTEWGRQLNRRTEIIIIAK